MEEGEYKPVSSKAELMSLLPRTAVIIVSNNKKRLEGALVFQRAKSCEKNENRFGVSEGGRVFYEIPWEDYRVNKNKILPDFR